MTTSFSCARCGQTFHTDTTEADMNRELLRTFPQRSMFSDDDQLVSVCDTCYELVLANARADGLI